MKIIIFITKINLWYIKIKLIYINIRFILYNNVINIDDVFNVYINKNKKIKIGNGLKKYKYKN